MSFKVFINSVVVVGTMLLASACGHRGFVPAAANNVIPGERNTAIGSASGVTMEVTADVWNGDPAGLRDVLTPVRVRIHNESERPIALRYRNFHITNPAGVQSNALPPFRINGSITEAVPIRPAFGYHRFFAYPGYRFYGRRFGYWADDWGWDPGWYHTYYGYWQKSLPTQDMLAKAIPEGVINPGGDLDGYLYFQKVPNDAQSLTFSADLFMARAHQPFARIYIPFRRQG